MRYDKGLADPAAAGMRHIDYGLSIIDRDAVLAERARRRGRRPRAGLHARSASDGRLAGYEVRERFFEIGSPAGLADLEAHLTASATQETP